MIIDGIEYAPVKAIPGKRAVVVIDRGWIYAGDVEDRDGRIYLTRVVWVFNWASIGFGAVVDSPHSDKADIRKHKDINIPAGAEVFRVPVGSGSGSGSGTISTTQKMRR